MSKEIERQNKAMQSILRGEKPEKRVFFGYEGDKELAKKEFEEAQRQIEEKLDATKEARMPWFCPKCDAVMKKRLDDKFWRLYGYCFDCQIKVENKMRIEGQWGNFERKKVLENRKSWIIEQIVNVREWKEKAGDVKYYNQASADGITLDEEKWNSNQNFINKMADEALELYENMKSEVEKELNDIYE
jgi:ribosomal protein L37AE/L43A